MTFTQVRGHVGGVNGLDRCRVSVLRARSARTLAGRSGASHRADPGRPGPLHPGATPSPPVPETGGLDAVAGSHDTRCR